MTIRYSQVELTKYMLLRAILPSLLCIIIFFPFLLDHLHENVLTFHPFKMIQNKDKPRILLPLFIPSICFATKLKVLFVFTVCNFSLPFFFKSIHSIFSLQLN